MLIGFGAHVAGIHHSPQRWLAVSFANALLIIYEVNYRSWIIFTSFLFMSNLYCAEISFRVYMRTYVF